MSFKNEKIRLGFELRKNKSWIKPFQRDTKWIWFHCASGEFEYAKPVITRLKEILPTHKILVTFFSSSVLKSLRSFSAVDLAVPMPWDTPWNWKEFIEHYKPDILAIARTDTWPNMIWQASRAKIPSVLFSATLPSTSGRVASFWGRLLYSQIVDNIFHISCVSDLDADNFRLLGSSLKISVDGDTRYDQVIARLASPRPIKFQSSTYVTSSIGRAKVVFVAGSTWPEDEHVILPALQGPLKKGLSAILAPHEPNEWHLRQLELSLKKLNIVSQRYSKISENFELPESFVCIVDEVGILAELYKLSTLSFVGGSFKKSVHSIMEPSAAGNLTLFGPYHRNSREATIMKRMGFAAEVLNSQDLQKLLMDELDLSSVDKMARRDSILKFVHENTGSSDVIASWIKNHIQN